MVRLPGTWFWLVCFAAFFSSIAAVGGCLAADEAQNVPGVCRPMLGPASTVELGNPGTFTWTCHGNQGEGNGYYIVFIRPSGTYVLLKVPKKRMSFEFTPDVEGTWRWLVINTDPDRSRPDVESKKGRFLVTPPNDMK